MPMNVQINWDKDDVDSEEPQGGLISTRSQNGDRARVACENRIIP